MKFKEFNVQNVKQAIILFETNRGTWALIGIVVHVQYHVIKKCQWRRECDDIHKNLNQAATLKFMIHVYHSCSTAWTSIDIGNSALRLLTCELHSNREAYNVMQEGSDLQHAVSSFLCKMSCLAQKVGIIWRFCNCSAINQRRHCIRGIVQKVLTYRRLALRCANSIISTQVSCNVRVQTTPKELQSLFFL